MAMAALFAFMVCVLGVVVYDVTHSIVLAEIRSDVLARATSASEALMRQPDTTPDALVAAVAADGVFVEIADEAGRQLAASSNAGVQRLATDPTAVPEDHAVERHVNGRPLFMAGQRVALPSGERYIVVARTPQPAYEAMGRLRTVLVPAVLISAVLTAAVAWFSVRRSLSPLTRLVAATEAIGRASDHRQRVERADRHDEIGRLATTVNTMLEALEGSHRAVAQAHETQRRFLTDVSHELRAPLTIMLSALDLTERIGPDDPAFTEQVVADVRAEAERMARSVKQLLVLARTGDNGARDHRPLLLADLVEELCQRWTRGGEQIDYRGRAPAADTVVCGDVDRLRQVFEVLLDNACSYTPSEGRVWAECETVNGSVAVTVADTGTGIAARDLSRVFDRYVRGDGTRSTPGLGLGLAIARQIVAEHDGTITVDSEPGRGSRFTVTLPLASVS